MAKWKCPYQYRVKTVDFIICKDLMRDGVDYTIRSNAIKSLCGCQAYCNCSSHYENTEGAKKCYEYRSKAVEDTDDE